MADDLNLLPLLTVVNGSLRGASFRLRPGLRRIGRADGVDILVEDRKVSRQHATVERVGTRTLLTDTGSTNGTWLNDQRLTEAAELRDGDRIRVGQVELRFFDPGAAATERVNTIQVTLAAASPSGLTADPAQRLTSGALTEQTQLMDTRRIAGRLLWTIGAAVVLVGWATWAWLVLQ